MTGTRGQWVANNEAMAMVITTRRSSVNTV